MLEVGAHEAESTLGVLLDRVQQGEEVVIMRQGRRVARLVPNGVPINREQVQAAAERILSRSTQIGQVS